MNNDPNNLIKDSKDTRDNVTDKGNRFIALWQLFNGSISRL